MKKIAISLFALAAVSTAALASPERGYELREANTFLGVNAQSTSGSTTNENAFAVKESRDGQGLSLQYFINRSQADRNVQ